MPIVVVIFCSDSSDIGNCGHLKVAPTGGPYF